MVEAHFKGVSGADPAVRVDEDAVAEFESFQVPNSGSVNARCSFVFDSGALRGDLATRGGDQGLEYGEGVFRDRAWLKIVYSLVENVS